MCDKEIANVLLDIQTLINNRFDINKLVDRLKAEKLNKQEKIQYWEQLKVKDLYLKLSVFFAALFISTPIINSLLLFACNNCI